LTLNDVAAYEHCW